MYVRARACVRMYDGYVDIYVSLLLCLFICLFNIYFQKTGRYTKMVKSVLAQAIISTLVLMTHLIQ